MQSRTANTTLTFIAANIGASDAVEMGRTVQAMTETHGWAQLGEFLGRMEADTLTALETGPLGHDVYLYNHGLMRGLRAASEIADGIIEAGKRADRELAAMNAGEPDG